MSEKSSNNKIVYKKHRHCNHCGGEGYCFHGQEDILRTCEVCQGKGFWNADDIRQYHQKYPKLCNRCCDIKHIEPIFK